MFEDETDPTRSRDSSHIDLTERDKLALSSAADACKQVLTLTTVIMTVSITFQKDVVTNASNLSLIWLRSAWLLYALSILAGCWMLLALSGSLGSRFPETSNAVSIYSNNIRTPATIQMATFALGIVAIVIFGVLAL